MAIITKPELALQGISLSNGRLYDDLSLLPGNHLRWTFQSDMGFPKDGFTIQRLSKLGQEKTPVTHVVRYSPPKILWNMKINLPANREEALNRLRMGEPASTLVSKFGPASQELMEVIHELKSPPDSLHMYERFLKTVQNSGLKSGLRIMDLMLLAAVDPYVARMIGLYVIDEGASTDAVSYYRVIGHWGDMTYPEIKVDFESISTLQAYQNLQFGALKILSWGRTIGIPSFDGNDIYPKHLLVHGNANPALKFYFDFPVQELVLEYELMSRSGNWDIRLDGAPAAGVRETGGNKLQVLRPGSSFQRVEFVRVPGTYWRIFKITYRKKATAIGDVQAVAVVDPQRTRPVPVPHISNLEKESMPAILDSSGKIQNEVSQVALSALAPLPRAGVMDFPDGASLLPALSLLAIPEYPVRTMFGRSVNRSSPETLLNQGAGIFSPSLYRENSDMPLLPSLLAYWTMDGDNRNQKNGVAPRVLGSPKFVKKTDGSGLAQFSLFFNGNESLELTDQHHLKELGDQFTLEATLNINQFNGSFSTIIGNQYNSGFWFGLAKQGDGKFKPRLWIKGRKFDATTAIPPDFWVRVSVAYNGNTVTFHFSGPSFSTPEPAQTATLGRIDVPAGNIMIGAESGSTETSMQMPFIGNIMDLAIWRKAIHPSESSHLRSRWIPFLGQQQPVSDLIFRDSTCYGVSTSRDQIKIEKTAPLRALASEFSVYLWALASSNNAGFTTLVGNNFNECFWIGLRKTGNNFLLRVWINHVAFEARTTFPADQWAHLGLAYDSSQLQLFVNGKLSQTHTAALGPLKEYNFPLAVGSDINSTNPASQYRFNGMIQDIQFWRKAIPIEVWNEKTGAVQYVDRYLKNDKYNYFVKGVDLFGRVSAWSPSKPIRTQAVPTYAAPLNLHAKFEHLRGILVSMEELEDGEGVKTGYLFRTSIPFHSSFMEAIRSYELSISRNLEFEIPADPEGEGYILGDVERVIRKGEQVFEITEVGSWDFPDSGNCLELSVMSAPFEQLIPESGDEVSIPLDFHYELKFSWSGSQQLYNEEIREFALYKLQGHLNEISGSIEWIETPEENLFRIRFLKALPLRANELVGSKCLIGPHLFVIVAQGIGSHPELTVRYPSLPLVVPATGDILRITIPETGSTYRDYHRRENWRYTGIKIPLEHSQAIENAISQRAEVLNMGAVSAEMMASESMEFTVQERKVLLGQGVDWIPTSRIYKLILPNFEKPAGLEDASPSTYVPGALVFFDEHSDRQRWRSFYVLWHQWVTDRELQLYVTPGEKEEELPRIRIASDTPIRFYQGRNFVSNGNLGTLPDFSDSPTVPIQLALTASDRGRESEISRWTTLIAVNRKRPAMAPKPEAEFLGKADYFGKCKVRVSWEAVASEPGALFKLYRSNDNAIYTRDLEQRRTRQGFYKGMHPEEVFQDDIDFAEWVQTQSAVRISELFAQKDSADWKEQTKIWRAWADRFYPSLLDHELEEIAARAGNEKAFSLVRAKPLREQNYVDEVTGTVKNRYYYRLRLQNEALAESTVWGPLSNPVIPPVVSAPAQPVFTKIEAGDRQITLHWGLNREPDFKEYVLYRAERSEDLEDLRWWSLEPDPRVVATIPDPRIKVKDRACSFPGEFPVTEILGIYLSDEFDSEASPLTAQPRAMNYWNSESPGSGISSTFIPSTSEGVPHLIENLKRIANGKAIVILYRQASDEVMLLTQRHAQIPLVDDRLKGLSNYSYRLVGINDGGLKSMPSKAIRAKSLELSPPPFPALTHRVSQLNPANVVVTLSLEEPILGMEISMVSRSLGSRFWKELLPWESLDRWGGYRGEFPSSELIEFRVIARSAVGKRLSESDFNFFSNELTS